MLECVSVDVMRRSDAYTIANLVSGLELIHRAAFGVFREVDWIGPAAIVTGSGNNGADGFALACILKTHQIDCTVYTVSERMHADCAYYAERARKLGVPILPYWKGCLSDCQMIVDCMLGTGFGGNLRENYRCAIAEINRTDAYVISVDINSGMNGDSGEGELVVCSDLTVTIGFVKRGQISCAAGTVMKRLVCVDIGIVLAGDSDQICDAGEWAALGFGKEQVSLQTDGRTYYQSPPYLDMRIRKYRADK